MFVADTISLHLILFLMCIKTPRPFGFPSNGAKITSIRHNHGCCYGDTYDDPGWLAKRRSVGVETERIVEIMALALSAYCKESDRASKAVTRAWRVLNLNKSASNADSDEWPIPSFAEMLEATLCKY
jgi:hypothetical protein